MLVEPSRDQFPSVVRSWHGIGKKSSQPRSKHSIEAYVGGGTWNEAFWRTISADRVEEATYGRTFFVIENGYMGLGSQQDGDEVWVLFGGDLPFILRPGPDSSSHTLIGDCYVQGIMNREAMVNVEKRGGQSS
jgi:hypothetical protein